VSSVQSHNLYPAFTRALYEALDVYGLLPKGSLIILDVCPVISLNVF